MLLKRKILSMVLLSIFFLLCIGLQGNIDAYYGTSNLYDLFVPQYNPILYGVYGSCNLYGLKSLYEIYGLGNLHFLRGLNAIYYGSDNFYSLHSMYGINGLSWVYGLGGLNGIYGLSGLYGLEGVYRMHGLDGVLFQILMFGCGTLASNPATSIVISLDINSLSYEPNNIKIFRSSNFFNPRTDNAYNIFYSEFDNHHAVRLRKIEVIIGNSEDQDDILTGFGYYKDEFIKLTKYTDNLIIIIAEMPKWLSLSSDESSIKEGWKEFMTHSPKDYNKWNELVRIIVNFFKQPEFDDVMIYYEIGSEPDIGLWRENTDSFLNFYKETALSIKATDPESKVGGTAVSSWNGKIMPQFESDNDRKGLNMELIAYAKKEDIPLDFISWHHFSINPNNLLTAKKTYNEVLQTNDYDVIPELIVSEWNIPSGYRESSYAASSMAEMFMGFNKAEIDLETFASWEDFDPNLDNLSGFGLITQNGVKKPAYYIYNFFDKLSRDSQGISVLKKEDQRIIVSRSIENEKRYTMLFWDFIQDPSSSALQYIISKIPREELISDYDIKNEEGIKKIFEQIQSGKSINGQRDKEFEEANKIYNEQLEKSKEKKDYTLEFVNFNNIIVHSAKAVKTKLKDIEIQTDKNKLLFSLEKNEIFNISTELLW